MEDDSDLELLTSLLEENEAAEGSNTDPSASSDEYDELFDGDEVGSYHESDIPSEEQDGSEVKEDFATLFGDTEDIDGQPSCEQVSKSETPSFAASQEKSKQELEDELKKMQEQMRKLQQQLKHTALAKSPTSISTQASSSTTKRTVTKSQCSPLKERNGHMLQESSIFATQLSNPPVPKAQSQETFKRKLSLSENKSPPQKQSSTTCRPENTLARPISVAGTPLTTPAKSPVSQQVSVEKYSGLRLRKPKVSSVEMERKMNGRKLLKLIQLQNKLTTEKLDDVDWVTFGVIIKKVTPQSSNNGKTFSIWRLNDLKSLDSYVSLFLFGDVHKEHWKTDQGTVIGILNASQMKPKEGSDEVCLSVDNPQKILLMGEAMDLGTCKSRKKNGEPCTQMVNLNDCEYCQYHIQAQYKKVSAKRADLQSSYSGHVPKKRVRGGNGLKERLCQSGFHYGGVSSMAYGASLASAAAPKKTVQSTLSNMVVKGAEAIALQAGQKIAAAKQATIPCSDAFKVLMKAPTPGALNLQKHMSGASTSKGSTKQSPSFVSISASELIKQQKQQLLDARKKKAEEIQRRFLDSTAISERSSTVASAGPNAFQSPKQAAEVPNAQKAATPKLGRGFTPGDDVLFFDTSPPAAPKLSVLADARKLAAVRKLQTKGQTLTKADPNNVKRPRPSSDVNQVLQRVESSVVPPEAPGEHEPAMKKRREQLAYIESEEFQKILKAKSKHIGVLKEAEAEIQEKYFEPLVKKEQMEEKMRSIREMKCRAVTCKTCKFTHYKLLDTCVSENHDFHWHDAVKRFFKCPCGNRTISLDRMPKKHCRNCGLFKWERDGMLKEKNGPKIGGETLLPRGEEHGKFLNSLK